MMSVFGMLGAKGALGLQRWIWIVGIAVLVFVAIQIVVGMHKNSLGVAEEAGATKAVVAGQAQTLEQLGDANEAERDLRNGGERSSARYNACLLDARDKAACGRYKPLTGQ